MAVDFQIKTGDTAPAIEVTLLDAEDVAVPLTGATVRFLMSRRGGELKVDAAATVLDALAGEVSYGWTALDTDTAGAYHAEWEVLFADGTTQTFPNSGYLEIQVLRDLG